MDIKELTKKVKLQNENRTPEERLELIQRAGITINEDGTATVEPYKEDSIGLDNSPVIDLPEEVTDKNEFYEWLQQGRDLAEGLDV